MSLFQRLVALAERIRDEFNSWKQLLGQANGIATLGADGKLLTAQRPPGGGSVPNASETEAGIIRVATIGETGGSILNLAVSPYNLRLLFGAARFSSMEDVITFQGDDVTTAFQFFDIIGSGYVLSRRTIIQITNVVTGNVVKDSEITINKDAVNDILTLTFNVAPTSLDSFAVCIARPGGY